MRDKITSLLNPKIKEIVKLRTRRKREKDGLIVVDGYREVSRAFEAKVEFQEVYACWEFLKDYDNQEILPRLKSKGITILETSQAVFQKISYGDRAEGILAVCKKPELSLKDLKIKDNALLLVVENLEKPGNLGAILRTCDGAGVDGIIVCGDKTDMYNPNVIRASLGTVFSLPAVSSSNQEAYDFLRSKNVSVCATLPGAKAVYWDMDLRNPLAIIVGTEDKGLSGFWVKHSDLKVKIPMAGQADSLNVSASTAVFVFEAVRQRKTIK